MKILITFFTFLILFASAVGAASAQKKTLTIILLRHAEKNVEEDLMSSDANLSAAGFARADKLVETLRIYKPGAIYSTNFRRTRYTVTPLADRIDDVYRLPIQIYDPKKLNELVARLLASNVRTIVVAGHNNTTPALANLLIKQDKYKQLGENEYDKIFIIKIKKGKTRDMMITY